MIDPHKAIQKLRRPPAVQNWVKNLRPRTDDTAHSLYNTAVNGPRHSLAQVAHIIRQIVVDGSTTRQRSDAPTRSRTTEPRHTGSKFFGHSCLMRGRVAGRVFRFSRIWSKSIRWRPMSMFRFGLRL